MYVIFTYVLVTYVYYTYSIPKVPDVTRIGWEGTSNKARITKMYTTDWSIAKHTWVSVLLKYLAEKINWLGSDKVTADTRTHELNSNIYIYSMI